MASFDIPSPSEILEITKQSIKDRSDKRTSKLTEAREEAINEILSGCGTKIREAAENGHHFAEIYGFEWVDDINKDIDSNGVRVKFGDVRIRDLLTKDRTTFFNNLNEKLNEGNTTPIKYYAYDRSPKMQKTSKWSIYVSWNTQSDNSNNNKTKKTFNRKFTQKSTQQTL